MLTDENKHYPSLKKSCGIQKQSTTVLELSSVKVHKIHAAELRLVGWRRSLDDDIHQRRSVIDAEDYEKVLTDEEYRELLGGPISLACFQQFQRRHFEFFPMKKIPQNRAVHNKPFIWA